MTIEAAGYIVTDNELIHGVGATADEAWADALTILHDARIVLLSDDDDTEQYGSWMRESYLHIRSASAGLLRDVEDKGGDCGWHMAGGVACTRDEADAA